MESCINLFSGHVSRILNRYTAEIIFSIKGNKQTATMDIKSYFYNAKSVISNRSFEAFTYVNMEVNFIAKAITQSVETPTKWNVILCWPKRHTLGDNVVIREGLVSAVGSITNLEESEGVLIVDGSTDRILIVNFTKSKLAFFGEELASYENWKSHLRPLKNIRFNAIPCIPEENSFGCEWQATSVYIGPKPTINSVAPKSNSHVYRKVLQNIDDCLNNPETLFVVGKGKFFVAIDDDFGLILAKFHDNIFKQVLFHKKNAHVFSMCLENLKLSEILEKGDEMNFIAVGNLPKYAEWVAVYVSIYDCRSRKISSL